MDKPLLIPELAAIEDIRPLTGDTMLFKVPDPRNSMRPYRPGQFMQLSVLGVGECPISITSTPTRPENFEFAVREVGSVSSALHNLEPGDAIGLRGPFGNGFPVNDMKGKDILFIAGGIGLAPLRSLINYMLDNRKDFGAIDIVYGARTPDLLCFADEFQVWQRCRRHIYI